MRIQRRVLAIVAPVLGAVALMGGGSIAAQGGASTPIAVDPAGCVVEPISIDRLVEMLVVTPATPERQLTLEQTYEGDPADAETVEAVTEAALLIEACGNTNDWTRLFALFTADAARFFAPPPGTPAEDIRAFVSRPVEPLEAEEWVRFAGLTDIVVLSDGRVAATLNEVQPSEGAEPHQVRIVFVASDGKWLGDAIFELPANETEATPEG